MRTSSKRIVSAVSLALALAAGSASATNGYYTHGTGTKSKAQAGAGSANPEEVLTLATNPAGIAFVGDSIDAGLAIFSPMRHYSTTPSAAPGACFAPGQCLLTIGPNSEASKNEFFPIPHIAAKWTMSEADHLGLAFYARGGMNTKWEGGTVTYDPYFGAPGSPGAVTLPGTFGDGTAGVDLMQGFLNLTYARKFGDAFSLGISGIVAVQRFEARGLDNFAPFTKTFVSTFDPTTGSAQMPKHLSDNGHDLSYGYGGALGFVWQPTPMFGLAAAYTSKMSMSDFGDYSDLFAQKGGFDMPSTWTVGLALRPSDRWALMFDVQGINYSDVDAVANGVENLFACPILPGGTDLERCLGGKRGAGFGWQDMTVYKFGASWKYSDDWTWRAGYSTTDQPIPKSQMTFNILAPGVMEDHLTFGFTQRRPGGNEVNLSFMYAPEVKVRGPQNFDPTQDVMFKMQQVELEISYSWKR
jgi:long-chain fatty acid transport protein